MTQRFRRFQLISECTATMVDNCDPLVVIMHVRLDNRSIKTCLLLLSVANIECVRLFGEYCWSSAFSGIMFFFSWDDSPLCHIQSWMMIRIFLHQIEYCVWLI